MKYFCFIAIVSCSLIGVISGFPTYQCFEEIGFCRCLAPDGTTIAGPSRTLTTCDCYVDRETELTKSRIGIVDLDIPICNEEGTYAPVQCNIWKGKCWCSDEKGNKTSDPIQGTPRC